MVEYPNLLAALRGLDRKTFIIVRLVFHLIKLFFCVFYCDWISIIVNLLVWERFWDLNPHNCVRSCDHIFLIFNLNIRVILFRFDFFLCFLPA